VTADIPICPKKQTITDTTLTLSTASISPSDHAKNLGVIFQSDLSLDKHISAIVSSCFYHIRDLKRIRSSLSLNTATILGNALVHSKLDYCNSLLFGLPKCSINRLQKAQNTLARVVSGASYRDHIKPILKSLHWLPVSNRIDYKICILTHRALSIKQPAYLASQLIKRTNTHALRSRSFHPLATPYCNKKSAGGRSFSYASPYLWNNLPESLRSTIDYLSFRRQLKTHFFHQAFPT